MEENDKYKKGLIKGKSIQHVCKSYSELDNFQYSKPQDFVKNFWIPFEERRKTKKLNNSVSGYAFEIIMLWLFDREGIQISSKSTVLHGVNEVYDVKPDLVVDVGKNKKIIISLKTSLRERWKQADWEAMHIKKELDAECIIISNNKKELDDVRRKLKDLHLDEAVFASSDELDRFFIRTKKELRDQN